MVAEKGFAHDGRILGVETFEAEVEALYALRFVERISGCRAVIDEFGRIFQRIAPPATSARREGGRWPCCALWWQAR